MFAIKRAYAAPEAGDGVRVLVDRLWPRGLSKERAAVDIWLPEIAPSDRLRRWFGHDPSRWEAFRKAYAEELKAKSTELARLRAIERGGRTVTLLFGARDTSHNNAVALKDILDRRRGGSHHARHDHHIL